MTNDAREERDWGAWFAVEVLLFLFQVLTFFIVAFITSYMFSDEARLTAFASAKINVTTISELGLTLFSVTFCFGLVAIIRELIPGRFVDRVSKALIYELPRTIYLFGSSITAAMLATATFLAMHPAASKTLSAEFWWMSVFFAIVFFAYGCGAKALLKRRSMATQNVSG